LTAYDGAYLALAEVLDATLITRDRAFASIKGHRARVLVL
jgi:predicted nucleic acid-binding protein